MPKQKAKASAMKMDKPTIIFNAKPTQPKPSITLTKKTPQKVPLNRIAMKPAWKKVG